ncbi:hypothetical protein EV189_1847 [Motilibacter rhizosphaerae]|uniref:Putative Flp pilus-assembly TadG-like N-terminal domain-containing protein n=1 Tax=Motilibacter rhizosphaerae TaxID=598652 RepID=A0A4Q7NSV9_9ACTN|nr:pilus assembly protein TadG-related protein [Motilibacter rhizosphaerae]RZS90064.1 hypothetical protein EV189_1847 [Motilibacter rhizosphaerae]
MSRLRSDETGTVVPLVLGVAAVVVGLLVVLADASSAFLAREALSAAADGAALSAAGAVDQDQVYAGGLTALPVDQARAGERAAAYLERTPVGRRYAVRLVAVRVSPTGTSVTVTLTGHATLPLASRLLAHGGVTLTATASADSPLR